MLCNHLLLCHPLLLLPSIFPASGSFPVSWLFTSGSPSIGASTSASVLPMSFQGWFPLELTSLISLQSSGLSGVFCTWCVLNRCSHVWLFATLWTLDHQAPQTMEFSRQESWSGLPCPPQGDLAYPGFKPVSPVSSCVAGGFFTAEPLEELPSIISSTTIWKHQSFNVWYSLFNCG